MRDESLTIEDLGVKDGTRWLKLSGPLTLSTTLFEFQTLVRANNSNGLALDFTAVPYIDSAGVGVLVGAYVRHQKHGNKIVLVGVNSRIREALKITRVEGFFEYAVNPGSEPQSDVSEY
jgi:anti-sigma B factor antagonist